MGPDAKIEQPGCEIDTAIYADGHVHLHPEYDPGAFFDAGLDRAREVGSPLILLLTEATGQRCFARMRDASFPLPPGLGLVSTEEACSLRVPPGSAQDPSLFLVCGRQLLSSERLEVLVAGIDPDDPLHDLAPGAAAAEELVRRGLAAGAITCLPWGFGKWLGARGRLVRSLCEVPEFARHPLFFLGDILARCWPWPAPGKLARGARTLPGTDILPLRGYESRLASYGFRVRAPFDPNEPARSLLESLRRGLPLDTMGARDSTLGTLYDQLRYRLRRAEGN